MIYLQAPKLCQVSVQRSVVIIVMSHFISGGITFKPKGEKRKTLEGAFLIFICRE
jgi:hypothetical protein